MQYIKGSTSNSLQKEFPLRDTILQAKSTELQKHYWGRHFWGRGFFCVSAGNVDDDMIRKYIENHNDAEENKDNFKLDLSL